ncbi:multicopper oxidase family protein [Glaciibacter superstes]|uniref:multicopper oxidase family protein n=1 Tax=Glaciibacter superstes TaxID=501023 RepID=UPI0003B6A31A|nr:multicopper oxidase family protein [Glaciibacter superstes]
MTGFGLLAIDLAVAVLTAGSWLAGSVIAGGLLAGPSSPTRGRLVLGLAIAGVLGVAGQAVLGGRLATHDWSFAQEKLLFALPLSAVAALVAVAVAGRPLVAAVRGHRSALRPIVPTVLVGAAAAGVAGILARMLVGYPLGIVPAVSLLALTVLATWLSYAQFAQLGRRLVSGIAALTALVLVASVGLSWFGSVAVPGALAETHAHGPATHGPAAPAPAESAGVSVEELRTPEDAPGAVQRFELTAQQQSITLASGANVSAWTYGSMPGPEIRVTQGDLVEVELRNRDIDAGVTIHWHGYDVPNGEDGVAGVTQDAVLPGEAFTYRFVADETGTYWYHTHQVSSDGVKRGLFGTLVVLPTDGIAENLDVTAPLRTLGGSVILGESDRAEALDVPAGESVRLRLVNTDQVPHRFRLDGVAFTVVAADGRDLAGPKPVAGKALRVPAGGRLDVSFEVPDSGVLLTTDASSRASLALSPGGKVVPRSDSAVGDLDLLDYGARGAVASLTGPNRVEAKMVLDRDPRFLHGLPAYGYTVNGEVYPHIPSIEVDEGDVVRLTVANRGWETHPMHVHGHHVLVVSRDGIRSTGSPLWLDTFDVQPGEVWVVEVTADNPGIWMDHCHNLEHAAEGMMMALAYRGVTSPFEEGGLHGNRAE